MRAESTPRVAYVVKRYPRFSETFIVNEILAHEAAGLDVEIFSLYPPNDTHFQDVVSHVRAPVTYLSAEGLRAVDFWQVVEETAAELPGIWRALEHAHGSEARAVHQGLRLAREIHRRGITHVHAHFATTAADVARLAATWAHVSWSVTAHAKDIYHESVSATALRRTLAGATPVVSVSDYNVAYLVETLGIPRTSVRRLYNGLDLAHFAHAPRSARAPHIVAVGRFVPKKGFDDLLRACAILRRTLPDATCSLIGGGPEESRLRQLVGQLDLGSMVRFLGPRPQAEVKKLVQDAAVFAAPCVVAADGDRDGLPTVLLESMALGTPVIATDVVGIPEIVRHDDTGLLVPERDPEALARALERLLTTPALGEQLSRQARALIERDFDVHRNAAQLRDSFARGATRAVARAS